MIHRNKKRYITERINEEVDEELQSIIWKMHEFLGEKRKDKMYYIQVFYIFKFGNDLVIKNTQVKPMMVDKLVIKRNYLGLERITVWIIDDTLEQRMLFPEEY